MTATNFWQLFTETGDPAYFLLYQEAKLETDIEKTA